MRAYVGVTDFDWYRRLSSDPTVDEVNFWRPGGGSEFRALTPGQPFLFKLHSPNNFIVGGGFFTFFSALPLSAAWATFGRKNGVPDLPEMRKRIGRLRTGGLDPREDPIIGCVILTEPFFFLRGDWIPVPTDWKPNIVQGKGYDLREEIGKRLWEEVSLRRTMLLGRKKVLADRPSELEVGFSFGLARRRLGQGAFRVGVTEVYARRCTVTGERTLPVLDAAHIHPVAEEGNHAIQNGLLLRSDIHTLFDRGYVTVTPEYRFQVSGRLAHDWHNGRVYYALDGKEINLPVKTEYQPDRELLEWHSKQVFLG